MPNEGRSPKVEGIGRGGRFVFRGSSFFRALAFGFRISTASLRQEFFVEAMQAGDHGFDRELFADKRAAGFAQATAKTGIFGEAGPTLRQSAQITGCQENPRLPIEANFAGAVAIARKLA